MKLIGQGHHALCWKETKNSSNEYVELNEARTHFTESTGLTGWGEGIHLIPKALLGYLDMKLTNLWHFSFSVYFLLDFLTN